jgi:hypothetical protein
VGANGGLELRLELVSGTELEAVLINRGRAAVRVLKDSDLQPSTLSLSDDSGRRVEAFDERRRRKFDTSVSEAMYSEVAPGGKLVLERSAFQKVDGEYQLVWGPFRFAELSPGAWKARAAFESKIDYVTEGGRQVRVKWPVWKGSVSSNEVEVRLR